MRTPQLPLPPIPDALRPPPRRPGAGNGKPTGPLDAAREAGTSAVDWVDERTSLSGAARWMMFRKIPRGTNWFYTLGSATMFAFLNQAVTGVLLAMYYDPSPTRAYESMRFITNEAFLGELVRGRRKWGATVVTVLIPAHGEDVLLRRLQAPARAQLGDRRRAGHPDLRHGPHRLPAALRPALLLGDDRRLEHHRLGPVRRPLPGRSPARRRDFGATRLSRFYAIHMLLIPGLMAGLIGARIYLVAKHGTTAPRGSRPRSPSASARTTSRSQTSGLAAAA